MSFALTIPQILDGSKTVTRRDGWGNLKAGELLWTVDKAMGLKAGEHPTRLKLIRVRSTRWEPLRDITQEDVAREGFPDWTPDQFIAFYCAAKKGRTPDMLVNRIEFQYMRLDPEMPVAVPEKVAKCPICDGKLAIEVSTGDGLTATERGLIARLKAEYAGRATYPALQALGYNRRAADKLREDWVKRGLARFDPGQDNALIVMV
ncbi:MAG TPA: hypothetical protein PK530_23920 [Anaerolineales bacterium]|nr:hypothetical protein [Anaerolineales bacterium]